MNSLNLTSLKLRISETCTHLHLPLRFITYSSFTKVGIFPEILAHPAVTIDCERNFIFFMNTRLVGGKDFHFAGACLLDQSGYLGC